MISLLRLLIFMLTRRWGLIVLGVLLLIIGLVVGAGSHQVSYQTIDHGTFQRYSKDDGTELLQLQNTSTFYVINDSDFSPTFNGDTVFQDSPSFILIARKDSQSVDEQTTDGTQLSGNGYQVEEITILDNNGQPAQQYTTSTYRQNPNGYYENDWPAGLLLAFVGLVLGILAFVLPQLRGKSKKAQPVAAMSAQAQMNVNPYANPYQQPGPYQQQNPYQQPYQNPAQYPNPYDPTRLADSYQQAQNPVYPPPPPPQQGSYDKTQLARPYDQP
ncbi:MAG TPA: hypothetical protein VKV40_16585 [Ktedonobacteraceae bacterium]|nr:hypothetical protein [Ktedonobacteraceae bacterium]